VSPDPGETFQHERFTVVVKEIHGPDRQRDPLASTAVVTVAC
jgi:hypothetical protein